MRGNVPVVYDAERRTLKIEKFGSPVSCEKAPQCSRDFGRRDRRTPPNLYFARAKVGKLKVVKLSFFSPRMSWLLFIPHLFHIKISRSQKIVLDNFLKSLYNFSMKIRNLTAKYSSHKGGRAYFCQRL